MTTDPRASTHHDVLWDGSTLYVASYRFVNDGLPAEVNYPTTLRRYSYNSSTKTYASLGSSQINNYRVEALSIDKDSTGRVWATWQQGNRIYLNVTGTDGKTWGTPFAHPASLSNVSVDDNSAVIAFGGNKIGVMWSRQVGDSTDGMYWSVHNDGASNTTWSTPVAAVKGQRSGDDHMNLKWLDASSDKVFAAIKTSYTSSSQPLIQLLALDASTSAWTAHTIATVAECPNRVIVMIDEAAQKLRTFATYPKPSGTTNAGVCTTSGGAIYEKSTSLGSISFSSAKTPVIVDADQYVHNVTSTKQNLNSPAWGTSNSGVLLLADVNATSRYWHHYEGGGGTTDTTAPTVTATSPADKATGVAVGTNVTGTFSEAMDAATITSSTFTLTAGTTTTPVSAAISYDGTNKVATLNPGADLAAGTTYTATIKGGTGGVKDLAGNTLAANKAWTFTTASAGTTDTTAPTVTATSPADKATDVVVGTNVTGTFSEAMDAATITSSTFTLASGTTTVSAAVTYDSTNKVATLNPGADLAAGTTYTATIKGGTGGVKDLAGNPVAADKVWTFTTAAASGGGTSETVTLTATADAYVSSGAATSNYGASTVLGVDSSPTEVTYLKFDLSAYAGRTIESATLQLRSAGSGSIGTQNVKLVADDSWTETGVTYNSRPALGTGLGTFGPTTTNTNYNITLTASGLAAELGQHLSLGLDANSSDGLDLNSKEASSGAYPPKLVLVLAGDSTGGGGTTDTTAPTVTATSPADKATDVAVGTNVTGTLSEAIDAASVSSSSFTLATGTTAVSAAVTYDSTNKVATLNPGADLAAGTTYTATLKGGTGGVKDLAGNPMAADKVWTFTTATASGGGTAETVTLTAVADAYVSSGAATTNNGTSTILGVDNSPLEVTYLKFDLSAYAGRTIESATLQLRSAGSGSKGTQNVKLVADDSWTETGITYNLRPTLGSNIGTFGPTTTNTNYTITLTASSLVGDLGQYLSLGLDANSSDGLDLNSKEASGGAYAPKLILTLS
ncbi:Ig-like domain-containing protein [Arthrobacter sp. MPF02]|uniref:Ig-like domain-containing protein n=1 Tax=Arthrobacter sp. MPF02 TaxID=3388492 RepID=UPI003984E537